MDDIEQRTTLIVRGTDKRDATPVQVRMYWALNEGKRPPAHLFLPKLLESGSVVPRIADLLGQGVRPSTLRYFLAEPYLDRAQSSARPSSFPALVDQVRTILPQHGNALLDERRLRSLDRKISVVLAPKAAGEELNDQLSGLSLISSRGSSSTIRGHCPSKPGYTGRSPALKSTTDHLPHRPKRHGSG